MAIATQGTASNYLQRAPSPSGLADVIDLILDKGLVIDAYVRVSVIGIELLTIDARIVIASVDTYLRFAEAVNRLDLTQTEAAGPRRASGRRVGQEGQGRARGREEGVFRRRRRALDKAVGEGLTCGDNHDRSGLSNAAGSLYVYGLTWAGRAPACGRGIGDARVELLEHGELAAIVSSVGGSALRAKRRDLLRHSDVLQHAFAQAPVLPLRFGTVLGSSDAVVDDLLAARYEELVALLQQFDGTSELRLRASFVEQAVLARDRAGRHARRSPPRRDADRE